MSPIQVIGLGSPFGADRVGWLAVERMASANGAVPGRRFTCLDRPGAGLVNAVAGAGMVFLVDAMDSAERDDPAVRELGLDELSVDDSPSTHGFGVADALMLARELGDLPPVLRIFGVPLAPDADEAAVEAAARRAADHILEILERL